MGGRIGFQQRCQRKKHHPTNFFVATNHRLQCRSHCILNCVASVAMIGAVNYLSATSNIFDLSNGVSFRASSSCFIEKRFVNISFEHGTSSEGLLRASHLCTTEQSLLQVRVFSGLLFSVHQIFKCDFFLMNRGTDADAR